MDDFDNDEWEDSLLPEDAKWIEEKISSDVSENAKTFLKELKRKMRDEIAVSNELLIDEKDKGNHHGIFFFRTIFHCFTIGIANPETRHIKKQITADSFRDAMNIELSDFRITGTMWDFLSDTDFSLVRYDRNYDLM